MRKITQTIVGTTPPLDKNVIWLDSTDNTAPVEKVFINGQWTPMGIDTDDYYTKEEVNDKLDEKLDVIETPVNGNLIAMNSQGQAIDSGKKTTDFIATPVDSGSEGEVLSVDSEGNPVWTTVTPTGTADTEMSDSSTNAVQNKVIKAYVDDNYARKDGYYVGMAVGLADNLRGNVYADEQFSLRMTGGEANEVGGIGVVQVLKGAGAAIVQMFPEGAGHDFSGDVSLDGTGGNAEAVLRYTTSAATTEMGYLLCLEAFVSQTLTQTDLNDIDGTSNYYPIISPKGNPSTKYYEKNSTTHAMEMSADTSVVEGKTYFYLKADHDKAVWLTPAGAITSAPTIESGQTEVTFSGWRIAMRVKASEVRDSSASTYWFTAGTAGRQVYDVAMAEGIDALGSLYPYEPYGLANGWSKGSAMEYLNHMAAQGLPTHSVKAMSALLAVKKIGIKTVKSRNLLNPQTGRALLKAYVNEADGFLDNEYTMLGGLPSGSTMAFTSLLTGKTETLTMLDATHFVIPSDGWLQITGTLPESIIATWGEKDNPAADEYATESHVLDVTQLFGTKSGGTEGHYYRFAKEGMHGAGTAQDVVELVGARGEVKCNVVDLGDIPFVVPSGGEHIFTFIDNDNKKNAKMLCLDYVKIPAVSNVTSFKSISEILGNRCISTHATSHKRIYLYDASHITAPTEEDPWLDGVMLMYELRESDYLTFTSLFLSASSTSDELTQMPADAIPLSEIQFADNNWSIEEAIYDAPEADANGVIDTIHQVTGQMRIQYSLDAAETIDTLKQAYADLEARVTALENA